MPFQRRFGFGNAIFFGCPKRRIKMLELFVLYAVLLALLMIETYDCCTFKISTFAIKVMLKT